MNTLHNRETVMVYQHPRTPRVLQARERLNHQSNNFASKYGRNKLWHLLFLPSNVYRPIMNLATNYLGMTLKNPIVPSAGPLSHTLDSMKRLEDAGAAAIVMYSLFEEQIEHEKEELEF